MPQYITKVSDGPSEDAIVNLMFYSSDTEARIPTNFLDVSTLEAPNGMVVKAVSIQEIWSAINLNATASGGNSQTTQAPEILILDSNDFCILPIDDNMDNHIDFTSGGKVPGLPPSDSIGNANGDLRYAYGAFTSSTLTSVRNLARHAGGNITLRLRKIYEDA